MSKRKKIVIGILSVYSLLVLVSSYVSFMRLHGEDFSFTQFYGEYSISGVVVLSIIFAWQSLYLILFSLAGCIIGLYINNLKLSVVGMISIIIPLVLFWGAYEIQNSRRYITGDGGPAGPAFLCITWDEPVYPNTYDQRLSDGDFKCVFYNIPNYNKFWVDQSRGADSNHYSASYHLTFFVLQGMLYLPFLIWQRRNIYRLIHRNS